MVLSRVADVPKHSPGFNRCQLVFIPKEDYFGGQGNGLGQLGQKGKVHHGGFIDDHHVSGKGVFGVEPEVRRIRDGLQKPVNG